MPTEMCKELSYLSIAVLGNLIDEFCDKWPMVPINCFSQLIAGLSGRLVSFWFRECMSSGVAGVSA